MKKKTSKKLVLSRETLRSLAEADLRQPEVAGGRSDTCPMACGSDAATVCFQTCACTMPIHCE